MSIRQALAQNFEAHNQHPHFSWHHHHKHWHHHRRGPLRKLGHHHSEQDLHTRDIHGRAKHHQHPHVDPAPLIQHQATPQQVHQAIHDAATAFGISPNLAGGIAQYESKGGDNNAHNASSQGLFQMQMETSKTMLRRHGKEIAEKLEATGDEKYKDIIADIHGGHLPHPENRKSQTHYNAVILDPYFNSLLGSALIKDNARDLNMKPTAANIADVYSMHVVGRHIAANDTRRLTDIGIIQSHIDSNQGILGANAANPNPTAAESHQMISREMQAGLKSFQAADKQMGLFAPDAAEHKSVPHVGKHGMGSANHLHMAHTPMGPG